MTDEEEVPPFKVINGIATILSKGCEKLGSGLVVLVTNTVRFGKVRQLGALLECSGFESQPFYSSKDAIEWLKSQ